MLQKMHDGIKMQGHRKTLRSGGAQKLNRINLYEKSNSNGEVIKSAWPMAPLPP